MMNVNGEKMQLSKTQITISKYSSIPCAVDQALVKLSEVMIYSEKQLMDPFELIEFIVFDHGCPEIQGKLIGHTIVMDVFKPFLFLQVFM